MPHLILEVSSNIIETNDKIRSTLHDCQDLLVSMLPTKLDTCKSRVVLHDVFVLGDDNDSNAFIHLTVKIIKGRSTELLTLITHQLKDLVMNDFAKSIANLKVNISVELVELSHYYISI